MTLISYPSRTSTLVIEPDIGAKRYSGGSELCKFGGEIFSLFNILFIPNCKLFLLDTQLCYNYLCSKKNATLQQCCVKVCKVCLNLHKNLLIFMVLKTYYQIHLEIYFYNILIYLFVVVSINISIYIFGQTLDTLTENTKNCIIF